MPTAPHRDRQAARPPELHSGDHVRDARAANDERRVLVERAIPDLAMTVVVRIPGTNDLPTECSLVDRDLLGGGAHCLSVAFEPATAKPDSRPLNVRSLVQRQVSSVRPACAGRSRPPPTSSRPKSRDRGECEARGTSDDGPGPPVPVLDQRCLIRLDAAVAHGPGFGRTPEDP